MPDDLEVVRLALADARQEGEGFESAWRRALASLMKRRTRGEADSADRDRTLHALVQTKLDWELAYRREPARPRPYPNLPLPDVYETDPALEATGLPRREAVA